MIQINLMDDVTRSKLKQERLNYPSISSSTKILFMLIFAAGTVAFVFSQIAERNIH